MYRLILFMTMVKKISKYLEIESSTILIIVNDQVGKYGSFWECKDGSVLQNLLSW